MLSMVGLFFLFLMGIIPHKYKKYFFGTDESFFNAGYCQFLIINIA